MAAALLAFAAGGLSADDRFGLITILEGEATVLQGSARFAAAEGQHLGAGAIVETGARNSLLRIERASHAIDLGPATRAMLAPDGFAAGGNQRPVLYLLTGSAKFSASGGAAVAGVAAPAFTITSQSGVAVTSVSSDDAWVFVESGEAKLVERHGRRTYPAISLHSGSSYQVRGGERGQVLPRPGAAMLDRLPRAFRDTLPLRAAAFTGRRIETAALPAAGYAELQPWLTAEPAVRRGLPARFAARAREPEFRRALIANLPAHPEWRPILYPPERAKPGAP